MLLTSSRYCERTISMSRIPSQITTPTTATRSIKRIDPPVNLLGRSIDYKA